MASLGDTFVSSSLFPARACKVDLAVCSTHTTGEELSTVVSVVMDVYFNVFTGCVGVDMIPREVRYHVLLYFKRGVEAGGRRGGCSPLV